jgi:phosphoribosylformylglycinamidine synthase subunit PurQ / glutaminase
MSKVRVLVLRAAGINRDEDMCRAWELAGAEATLRHINEVVGAEANDSLENYHILAIPGGFSYGDDLGAGKLYANELIYRLKEPFFRFVESGRPVLGVCNGFQVLAKTGVFGNLSLLPNESGHFECRWVELKNPGTRAIFLQGVERMYVPVAHGEGRVALGEGLSIEGLAQNGQIALQYVNEDGSAAEYPANPNGSVAAIAGVTNATGTVFGLMPHPENHVLPHQHPRWTRLANRPAHGDGLQMFKNAVSYAAN